MDETPVTCLRLHLLPAAAVPYLSRAAAFVLQAEFSKHCSRMQYIKGYAGILWQREEISVL